VDWLLLIIGTGLGLVSLTADLIGIGGYPGFGWKQATGTVVALVLVLVSAVRIIRRDRRRER
jgi:heme exporter protein D